MFCEIDGKQTHSRQEERLTVILQPCSLFSLACHALGHVHFGRSRRRPQGSGTVVIQFQLDLSHNKMQCFAIVLLACLAVLASASFTTTCSSLGIVDASTCRSYDGCSGASSYSSATQGGTSCACGASGLVIVCTGAQGEVTATLTSTAKSAGCPTTNCDCRAKLYLTNRGDAVSASTILDCIGCPPYCIGCQPLVSEEAMPHRPPA